MFNVATFIRESNLIDPQFSENGILFAGENPGEIMFENQLRAVKLIPEICQIHPTPLSLVLMLHRELTRGLSVYEQSNDSGMYRHLDVYIGGEKAPQIIVSKKIIEEILIPEIEEKRKQELSKEEVVKFAWWCHDLFECAHPFVDGNGRTGRLLLNTIMQIFEHEWIVVYFDDRYKYYKKIQEFRAAEFPGILVKSAI